MQNRGKLTRLALLASLLLLFASVIGRSSPQGEGQAQPQGQRGAKPPEHPLPWAYAVLDGPNPAEPDDGRV